MKKMKNRAGFTMIELLVAMAVTMVVLAGAVLAFRDSTKANSNVTQRSDTARIGFVTSAMPFNLASADRAQSRSSPRPDR